MRTHTIPPGTLAVYRGLKQWGRLNRALADRVLGSPAERILRGMERAVEDGKQPHDALFRLRKTAVCVRRWQGETVYRERGPAYGELRAITREEAVRLIEEWLS